MSQDTFQLTGNAAAIYEEQKVPAIFKPLALATLNVLFVKDDDHVIDVACGTGIVGRQIVRKLGPTGRVVGVDLNEGMIEIARKLTKEDAPKCEWHAADVTSMPFDANSFTLAVCQQGLQFFPDEERALREIHRVLQTDGRIAVTVWAGASDFFKSLADALSRHVGEDVAQKSLAPFQYNGMATLADRLSDIGYKQIDVTTLSVDRKLHDPTGEIPKEILGNSVGSAVSEKGQAVMQQIVTDVIQDLSASIDGGTLIAPQQANLITATVS